MSRYWEEEGEEEEEDDDDDCVLVLAIGLLYTLRGSIPDSRFTDRESDIGTCIFIFSVPVSLLFERSRSEIQVDN